MKHPNLAFVAIRTWDCHAGFPSSQGSMPSRPFAESIRPVSAALRYAFEVVAKYNIMTDYTPTQFHHGVRHIPSPPGQHPVRRETCYSQAFLFHHRQELARVNDPSGDVALLLSYLSEQSILADIFRFADEKFAAGRVTCEILDFLYAPNEILISSLHGPDRLRSLKPKRFAAYVLNKTPYFEDASGTMELDCWGWVYNGECLSRRTICLGVELPRAGQTVRMTDLAAYPLKFASSEMKTQLVERVHTFWSQLRFK